MPRLDSTFVRRQFPAFTDPHLKGWAFFENAGGSYPCQQVIDRLQGFYQKTKVQPYGHFPASQSAGRAMDEAYLRLSEYLNVGEDEICFGPSTSQNTYVLANAFRDMWKAGDEIVVSNQEHEANAGVWWRLAEKGIAVREWRIDSDSGRLNPAELDELLSDKTRLVAFPHCSNVVAHINPVAEIVAKAHAAGAIVVTDGVSYAPHGFPDIRSLGVDIYLFSLYKTYGPHQGLMAVRRELLDRLLNQSHFFNAGNVRKKLVPAGPDHAQVAASAGVADYFDCIYGHHFSEEVAPAEMGRRVHDLFRAHEMELLGPLLRWLSDRDDVRIIGPADEAIRAPTVSIVPKKRDTSDVLTGLERHRIMAGSGHFYAVRPLEGLSVPVDPGVLRFSFVHYTTRQEIDQLIEALEQSL